MGEGWFQGSDPLPRNWSSWEPCLEILGLQTWESDLVRPEEVDEWCPSLKFGAQKRRIRVFVFVFFFHGKTEK